MSRVPPPAWIAAGVVLTILSVLGVTYSEHAAARVVYAILLPIGLGAVVLGLRGLRSRGRMP
jgi:hypothetical protein